MIRKVEALRYRCLLHVSRPISAFQILVGPNASGKTSFLDIIRFLGLLVSEGLDAAIGERSENLEDLVWQHQKDAFELAIEVDIPKERRQLLPSHYDVCRYEVRIGIDLKSRENSILAERLLLMTSEGDGKPVQREIFPDVQTPPKTILKKVPARGIKTVVNKVPAGNDNFYDETGKGWDHAFKLGPRKSALGNLPEDETKFPVATWVKSILTTGIETIALNSASMRKPSPPGQPKMFRPDGSNLPWVVEQFKNTRPRDFERWLAHVRTALPDLETIETVERPEDKHRYLRLVYNTGVAVPSWTASDGTLRLLALTLLGHTGNSGKVFLIEEPENGIHPLAVETVYQSLASAYEAQILCATHSPIILSLAEPKDVLCFAKTPKGATDIVRGDEHPNLRDWKRGADLGTLFATGVLG
ncbi:AAA family ATPase [Limisphaera ngatamarikiensis]|uniref:AAA family ATPase n=1 Tax=Limisphaera ngatamarikiensis TaxID=1324935 RepID=A0A6M1RR16_9BACT|nr:ATP-binding protein [Limisphaera ngatamarikiensis]NGO39095.1 AAA family ATPase [Limisphaera ngatamarikiensis]